MPKAKAEVPTDFLSKMLCAAVHYAEKVQKAGGTYVDPTHSLSWVKFKIPPGARPWPMVAALLLLVPDTYASANTHTHEVQLTWVFAAHKYYKKLLARTMHSKQLGKKKRTKLKSSKRRKKP